MKIEYNGVYASVLSCHPLPCKRCAFSQTLVCTNSPKFYYPLCGLNGFEKDPGFIFKV